MRVLQRSARGATVAALLSLGAARSAPPPLIECSPLEARADTTANASVGDLDGDGRADIVLAKGRHWPILDLVLLNDGHGKFADRHTLGDRADRSYTAALGDLDGDGDLDVVVGNDAPDPKVTYLNDGHGRFAPGATFGDPRWPTRNVTLADVNGDRRPDIIVANRGGAADKTANYTCLNDGHGRFPDCRVLSGESATTIAAADLNGDGAVDLIVPHRDEGQSWVYLNDGKGGFAKRVAFGPAKSATRAVAVGDLDGDGRADIVIGDEGKGGVYVYFNQGKGVFSDAFPIGAPTDNPYSIAIVDIDGDGHADIVLGNERTSGAILLNNGTGKRFTGVRFGDAEGPVYGLGIGDLNGDRRPDIVAARSDARTLVCLNLPGK